MKSHDREAPKTTLETEGRSQLIRHEVIEMHLSGTNAVVPKALCEAATSHDLRDLKGYLVDLLLGAPVGAICQDCKALAMPLVENIVRDMEAEGSMGEAEDCRELLNRLARETGLNRGTS